MDTTFVPENGINPLGDDEQPSGVLPRASEEPAWYTVGESSASNQLPAMNSASGAFSHVSSQPSPSGAFVPPRTVPSPRATKRQGPGVRLLVIGGVVLLLAIVGSVSVFASAAPRLFANHQQAAPAQIAPVTPQPEKTTTARAVSRPTPMQAKGQSTPIQAPGWLPSHLPTSCAGVVTTAQGLNANNEAVQFTLREENISYQSIGGLQSSTALMTPKTKTLRFVHDRRSNPAFAQRVLHEQLIQLPANLQPVLQQCQQRAGTLFAWAVVSFNRATQCSTDDQGKACQPNPDFAPETDQQRKPVVHTMAVLMVMVPKGQDNPPLWLGWSVADYMIDEAPALPAIPPAGQV